MIIMRKSVPQTFTLTIKTDEILDEIKRKTKINKTIFIVNL